jgi:hypothetical protein
VGSPLLDQPKAPSPDELTGVLEAAVSRASASDLYFTVPDLGPDWEFGPAPYPRPTADLQTSNAGAPAHSHAIDLTPVDNAPPTGTSIAVSFVGGDPDRPFVLAIYGWPS